MSDDLFDAELYRLHRERAAQRQRDETRANRQRIHRSQDFRGDVPPYQFESDGCTLAPDKAFNGADLSEACRWHDWAYTRGGNERDRRTADRDLLHNLKASGCPWWQRRLYYHRVRFWGTLHFHYQTPHRPPRVRHWLRLLWLRYVDKYD